MRLKFGRPDIAAHRDRFDLSTAGPDTALAITWLGVSTLLVDDGRSAVMTDGFFSRPGLLDVGLRKLRPSMARIEHGLTRAKVDRLAAVLPVHTHFDHVMDSAIVAERTGAVMVGGESTANVARGQGLSADRIVVATPGSEQTFGSYGVTLIESHHCPPDRFPGEITRPVTPPVKVGAYRCGEAWSTLIHHRASDRRLLIQGSAGFVAGALSGRRADVAYLGVGQLGVQPERYIVEYWNETVRTVGAGSVILIHWDDFFRPLSKPLRALPYAADDLDFSIRTLTALADRDGVTLHLPQLWQPCDPWA